MKNPIQIPEKHLLILLNAINAQALVERCDKIAEAEADKEVIEKTREYQEFLIRKMEMDVSHSEILEFFTDVYQKADFFMAIAFMAGRLDKKVAQKINDKIQWALWEYGRIDLQKIEEVVK